MMSFPSQKFRVLLRCFSLLLSLLSVSMNAFFFSFFPLLAKMKIHWNLCFWHCKQLDCIKVSHHPPLFHSPLHIFCRPAYASRSNFLLIELQIGVYSFEDKCREANHSNRHELKYKTETKSERGKSTFPMVENCFSRLFPRSMVLVRTCWNIVLNPPNIIESDESLTSGACASRVFLRFSTVFVYDRKSSTDAVPSVIKWFIDKKAVVIAARGRTFEAMEWASLRGLGNVRHNSGS